MLKGGHHSEEAKKKMSESHKGMRPTEETRKKLSESHRGIRFTKETRKKLSKARMGKHHSEKTKKKMSENQMGEKNHSYGKHQTEESNKKRSESQKGMFSGKNNPMYGMSGSLNPAWEGGKSFEPYGIAFNNELRKQIRNRDNHICQLCKVSENGRALSVHHIDYNKRNNSELNLVALCRHCHLNTNVDREIWNSVLCEYQNCRELGVGI